MKRVLVVLATSLSLSVFAAETKKVCIDKMDSKGNVVKKADGTVVQECKEMKVHKKLEGTKVPEKK